MWLIRTNRAHLKTLCDVTSEHSPKVLCFFFGPGSTQLVAINSPTFRQSIDVSLDVLKFHQGLLNPFPATFCYGVAGVDRIELIGIQSATLWNAVECKAVQKGTELWRQLQV